ncbi:WEB family protein At3g02930, chloroplastic-like [Curcuma longa]|uniref:WEB family protein At3g02930, chloroplastic-like n=1 Tax=Curcuma longa TaxID=136217 RepID=UPI003D9F4563
MLSSKARSSVPEASNGKPPSSTTPRVGKVAGNGSTTKSDSTSLSKLSSPLPKSHTFDRFSTSPKLHSLLERSSKAVDSKTPIKSSMPSHSSPAVKPRPSVDRSPISVESKPTIKTTFSLDKPQRSSRASELQAKLDAIEEELLKAKEELSHAEQEKIRTTGDLLEATRLASEANEKLQEAIISKETVEKSLEIQKFRTDELEQMSIEAAQKMEAAHQEELARIQDQHAMDISALLSVTNELQKVKLDLANVTNEKDASLREADGAKKTARSNSEKVEALSKEVSHLKSLLDSKLDNMSKEAAETIKKLNADIDALQVELERAKTAEEKLPEVEALVERLRMEITDAKKATADASKEVGELKKAVTLLEIELKEANQSKKSATESLETAREKIQESTTLLQDAETEIADLKRKVKHMEIEVANCKIGFKDSERNLDLSQEEVMSLSETVKVLKDEVKKLEEEKLQALDEDKAAAFGIEKLLKEKDKLNDELKTSKDEVETVKKAMEELVSALHDKSSEVRENQERLLAVQTEMDDSRVQIEQLNSAFKNTEERYEVMLDEARYEIVCLKKTIEKFETEMHNYNAELGTKELNFLNDIKKSENEVASLKVEMEKVLTSLDAAEGEAQAAKADKAEMTSKLKQAESAAAAAYQAAEEAKTETLGLKDTLLDKENELQSIAQENADLRIKETAALQKIKELSLLLEETMAKKTDAKIELPENENTHDALPIISLDGPKMNEENDKGNYNDDDEDHTDAMPKDFKSEKDHETETDDDDDESRIHNYYGSLEQTNSMTESNGPGIHPFSNIQQQPKKKNGMLHKFGHLLKRGSQKEKNHK